MINLWSLPAALPAERRVLASRGWAGERFAILSILHAALPLFQTCGVSRTYHENPFSPCSVQSMMLRVPPLLTRRAL